MSYVLKQVPLGTCAHLSLKCKFLVVAPNGTHGACGALGGHLGPKAVPAACQERWSRTHPLAVSDGGIQLSFV